MYKFKILFYIISFLFFSKNIPGQPLEFVEAFPHLTFSNPLFLTHANDASGRVFIIEKVGIIRVMRNDSTIRNASIFLDITNLTSKDAERGLLGLAFHPDYLNNGYFFVNYTRAADGASIVSRFTRSTTDPNKADSLSEMQLLDIPQPFGNHNGGMIFFGMDGYLYIGMGDGGAANDPNNLSQNLNELIGKILRVNVDTVHGDRNYSIPSTNPFAAGGGRPEIFAVGMRNPWRMSLDPVSGLIYCGDVGQDAWEEINIIENGKNYGWRCYEGNYATKYIEDCNEQQLDLAFPIKVYPNAGSDIAVTGGYVYRGQRRPELTGRYIYSDFGSRKTWKLKYENGVVTEDSLLLIAPAHVFSYGTDEHNELYLCGDNDKIYRFNKSNVVGTGKDVSIIPGSFNLYQNYPNPFNPATSIKYSMPVLSHIELKIYDINGREIKKLVNRVQVAGEYNIIWNGKDSNENNVPSGVYFYSLNSDKGFSDSKRMVLIK